MELFDKLAGNFKHGQTWIRAARPAQAARSGGWRANTT
jgi:hypothetical protein